jgi:hypothetical protein
MAALHHHRTPKTAAMTELPTKPIPRALSHFRDSPAQESFIGQEE